ncbi:hypothetical protein NUW58_g6369 [Xylaria curta]|uniref:Uncharacterized protein n=1 Tax=Xylaria curta TaxID=42375 RepID=A0ACC1NUQ0_9PEZI|nr:hypothetical protein NUW58_g6369 [Xylaria curta]
MAPVIDIVRHGEAYHNIDRVNGPYLRDPSLTPTGVLQCQNLGNSYPYMDQVYSLLSSPMRRTIQTTHIAFEQLLGSRMRVILVPELTESSARPSDTGSPWQELRAEFGYKNDLQLLHDGWWFKDSSTGWGADPVKVAEQARKARLIIRNVARHAGEDDHIVVVTHSKLVVPLLQGDIKFENAQFKSFQFVNLHGDDDQALLTEATDGSSSSSSGGSVGSSISPGGPIVESGSPIYVPVRRIECPGRRIKRSGDSSDGSGNLGTSSPTYTTRCHSKP